MPRTTRSLAVLFTLALAMAFAPVAAAQPKPADDAKSIWKNELPPEAREITDAAKSAKVGDPITLHGHVALAKDAFDPARAVFTLVDESARTDTRPPADKLPDTLTGIPLASRATIRVVGDNGAPMSGTLRDQRALKAGVEVFVTGKVSAASSDGSIVVDATALHVPRGGGLPPAFFTDTPGENAKDISEARKAAAFKVGQDVVLRGRVGGSKQPFVAGRAVFTLMGRGLKACNENPDDKCKEPWDYCCESKADITVHSVTVQVVDAKGQPIRTDVKGRRGIKELTELVVVGKVSSTDGKAVVVNATSIHVAR